MTLQTIELPIGGMTCTDCAADVQRALEKLPGVASATVLLAAEKAVVQLDPAQVDMPAIEQAIAGTGCSLTPPKTQRAVEDSSRLGLLGEFTRPVLRLFSLVFGVVLLVVVIGEVLGVFETVNERVPAVVWLAIVLVAGFPIFRAVLRAAFNRQVTSHTLMTIGLVAALLVGEYTTALLVVFFMRLAEYVEGFTTERARRAVKDLTNLAPQTAWVERDSTEEEIPIAAVQLGDIVVVRPGEQISVDGEVVSGTATINQAAITGEALPVEVEPGASVYAATITTLGSLRVRATHIGADTTFGRVIRLVEEAETHRADVQRIADKFSAYYLPVVAGVAALTFLLSRNPLATAAVLVVACSCSFALATPLAMLASIGAAAKRGLLIKGGKYLETLSRADVLLIDKTGTVTLGNPQITDVVSLNGVAEPELLALAAAAERYSEHPLAEAVRQKAAREAVATYPVQSFTALPGMGVQATVQGQVIIIGNQRMVGSDDNLPAAAALEAQGKTLLYLSQNNELVGLLAAADTERPEMPQALTVVRRFGIKQIELLTGDNERTAAHTGLQLGISYRAQLLPEDKIAIVKAYQAQGHTVVMVGDGVNDAPALAQADVGIAMGAMGTDVALEAAHIALMRDDWLLVPEVLAIAHNTMRVVRLNIGFTAVYNLLGLSLAALGILPPIFAAAAQSLPDVVILGNSSRLLRQGNRQRNRIADL